MSIFLPKNQRFWGFFESLRIVKAPAIIIPRDIIPISTLSMISITNILYVYLKDTKYLDQSKTDPRALNLPLNSKNSVFYLRPQREPS